MSSAYTPWSGADFSEEIAESGLSQSSGTKGILPRFRVHTRVLHDIHRRIRTAADGDVVGSLYSHHVDGMLPDLPSTLFANALVPVTVPSLGQSASCVFIPVVKCQDTAVPAVLRSGQLKWRRLNARGAANTPATALFRLFNTVALCSQTGAAGTQGVSLVLTVELPSFSMWEVPVDGTDGKGPLVADVSLAIALAGGTPVHEGEDIGFLARPSGLRGRSRIVEPVHLAQADGRDVVGVWALGGRERARFAAAVYIARSQSRRNLKIQRRKAQQGTREDDGVREVGFVLAQYSKERGGPPILLQCQARVEAREETYVASIADASVDEFVDTLVADFRAASSFAEEEGEVLHGGAIDAAAGNLERLAGHVDALRAALDANTPRELETEATGSGGVQDVDNVVSEGANNRATEIAPKVDVPGERVVADFGDLPRALDVDFDADDLGGGKLSGGSELSDDGNDEDNWERIQLLAEKYLGPDYSRGT